MALLLSGCGAPYTGDVILGDGSGFCGEYVGYRSGWHVIKEWASGDIISFKEYSSGGVMEVDNCEERDLNKWKGADKESYSAQGD